MQPENHLTPAHAAPATRRTPQPLTAVAFAFGPKHRKYSQKSPAVLSQCRKLAAYLHALGHCGYRLDALCPAGSSAAPAAPGEEWSRLHALLKDAVREAAENPEGPANVAFFKTPHGVKSALRAVILVRGREPGSTYEFVVVLAEGSLPLEAILHVLAQAQPLKAITGGTVKLKLLRGVRRLFRKHPTITHQLETAETLKGREVETDAPFTALALAGPHPADLRHHQTTPHPAEPLLFLAGAELGACSARLNANTAGSPVATADTHYRRPRAYLAAKVPELLLRTKGMAERLKSLPPPADQIDRPLTAERLLAELPRRFSSLAGAAGRKCARASVLTAAVLSTVLLSGCGAMIGLDAKDDFSCPAAEGVPCRSLSTVYELTKSDALPHQVHPVDFAAPVLEGPQGRTARPESVEPPAKAPVKVDTPVGSGAGTTNAVSETLQPAATQVPGTAQNLAAASSAAEDGAAAPHAEARAPSAPNSTPPEFGSRGRGL